MVIKRREEIMSETEITIQTEAAEKPITMDELAIKQTQVLAALDEHEGKLFLRVYLEGKGCDGFTYGVAFDTKNDDDLVFPQEHEGYKIDLICDPDSFQFLKSATITFVNDMRGVGYVVENPRHKRFQGKFYKKKSGSNVFKKTRSNASFS